jgi:hypothetical protein
LYGLYFGIAGNAIGTIHTVSQLYKSISHTPQESNHPAVSFSKVVRGAKENISNKY